MKPSSLLFPLALLAAVACCYAPGLKAPTAYDDHGWVLHNPRLKDPAALLCAFWDPTPRVLDGVRLPGYAYRPLTEASFALNGWLTGLTIEGLRLGNVLLHAISVLLVYHLAKALGDGSPGFARWAALLFALHPVGVQAVTYVYQRAVVLEALLAFATLALFLRGGACHWLALATGLLAMTAKETGATLPLSLGAAAWILRRPGERGWHRWLPFALLPLLVLVQALRARAAQLALGSDFLSEPRLSPLAYLAAELPTLLGYLATCTLPFPLSFVQDRPAPPGAWTLVAGAALLLLAAWILLGPDRHRLPRLGLALFLAPLALESSVFPLHETAALYRCYPGLLGAGLLFAWGLGRLRKAARPIGIGVLLLLGSLTMSENRVWAEPPDLMPRDVRHAPRKAAVWGDYAWDRLVYKRAVPAERLSRRGLRQVPTHPKAVSAHAYALLALGHVEEGCRELEAGIAAFPGCEPLRRLARALREQHLERGDEQDGRQQPADGPAAQPPAPVVRADPSAREDRHAP